MTSVLQHCLAAGAEEAPLYNQLAENEKKYALFADGSCGEASEMEGRCM